MRIPIYQGDLAQGRLTKIARALQKQWKAESLSLMQAQNFLAGLLGYRNLHDLQSHAVPEIPQLTEEQRPSLLSRAAIVKAVAWQLFRRHQVSLATAADLAAALHLNELSVDAITADAATDRLVARERAQGRYLFLDEFHHFANRPWSEKTPAAIDAGLPAYRIAVLPDRRMFTWSALESLLERLPPDYLADLSEEPKYQAYRDKEELNHVFIREELFPLACEPLESYIARRNVLPDGFHELWLFDEHNACVGRALHNVSIGGIIPELFSVAGSDLAQAAVALYCGDSYLPKGRGVAGSESEALDPATLANEEWKRAAADTMAAVMQFSSYQPRVGDLPLSTFRYRYLRDEEFRKQATTSRGPVYADSRELVTLPGAVRLRRDGGSLKLCGHVFVEAGQIYLRYQPDWLTLEDVPRVAMPATTAASELAETWERDYANSTLAIPNATVALFGAVKQHVERLFKSAADRLRGPAARADMAGLLFGMVTPQQIDAYCESLIRADLPVRYQDDSADNPVLVEERDEALRSLVWDGGKVKLAIPELFAFSDATLGYVLLHSEGEGPGSRNAGFVHAPAPHDPEKITHFLVNMIYMAVCCQEGEPEAPETHELDILRVAVGRVLDGDAQLSSIHVVCAELSKLRQRLAEHAQFAAAIEAWRARQEHQAHLRGEGAFLYVGDPVPREKPKQLAQLIAEMGAGQFRRQPLITVQQTLSDLERPEP